MLFNSLKMGSLRFYLIIMGIVYGLAVVSANQLVTQRNAMEKCRERTGLTDKDIKEFRERNMQ